MTMTITTKLDQKQNEIKIPERTAAVGAAAAAAAGQWSTMNNYRIS